jgi:Flp pilus assembly protein TadB
MMLWLVALLLLSLLALLLAAGGIILHVNRHRKRAVHFSDETVAEPAVEPATASAAETADNG